MLRKFIEFCPVFQKVWGAVKKEECDILKSRTFFCKTIFSYIFNAKMAHRLGIYVYMYCMLQFQKYERGQQGCGGYGAACSTPLEHSIEKWTSL